MKYTIISDNFPEFLQNKRVEDEVNYPAKVDTVFQSFFS